jgi:hypothetical protein
LEIPAQAARYRQWNGWRLGDIPNESLKTLWKSESADPSTRFVADKLLGEIIRRGLIGKRRKKNRPRR